MDTRTVLNDVICDHFQCGCRFHKCCEKCPEKECILGQNYALYEHRLINKYHDILKGLEVQSVEALQKQYPEIDIHKVVEWSQR